MMGKKDKKDGGSELFTRYAAEGCQVEVSFLPVSDRVALRLITFYPPHATNRPPVLFVPGWISRLESWERVLGEMTKDFPVYYLETREKVTSRIRGSVAYSVEALGDDLARAVEYLSFASGRYLLFGSSLGATVILDAYRKLPKKPLALILVGPNAVFYVPFLAKIVICLFYPGLYFVIRPVIKWYLRTFRMRVDRDCAQYDKYCRALDAADPFKLKKAAMAFWRYRIWGVLDTVDVPVLLVGGSDDTLHEPENLRKMAEGLPRAQYVDMRTNSATHSEALVTLIREFLTRGCSQTAT